jgi:hypothetical protein
MIAALLWARLFLLAALGAIAVLFVRAERAHRD